jgi:hypothetical protein
VEQSDLRIRINGLQTPASHLWNKPRQFLSALAAELHPGSPRPLRKIRTLAEITSIMAAETWLTADEAFAASFASEIESEPDEQVEQNALAIAKRFRTLARLKHLPDRFRADAKGKCECNCVPSEGDCASCDNPDCEDENCQDCPMQLDNLNNLQTRLDGFDKTLRLE